MKIAMLAHAESAHTMRWCEGLLSRGYQIRLISGGNEIDFSPGIDTAFLPGTSPLSFIKNSFKIEKTLESFSPDIVHAHYATSYALWGMMQNLAPLVVSVWGTDIIDAARKKLTIGPITRKALKKASKVTATSKYLIDKTIKFEPSVANKISHIPFSLPFSDLSSRCDNDGKDIIKFIFTKRLLANYAPDLILKAFAEARKKIPPSHLRMIGGGLMQEKLENLARELKIENHVSFEGWLDKNEVGKYIADADVMLMPSYQESFGVAALEAASCGVPVIATNVGGIPEIIHDGISGVLIQPGDEKALAEAMIRLGNNSELRKKMGNAGAEFVRMNYNWDVCLDKMEKVYQKVCENR